MTNPIKLNDTGHKPSHDRFSGGESAKLEAERKA
jgi:hypothetical protein